MMLYFKIQMRRKIKATFSHLLCDYCYYDCYLYHLLACQKPTHITSHWQRYSLWNSPETNRLNERALCQRTQKDTETLTFVWKHRPWKSFVFFMGCWLAQSFEIHLLLKFDREKCCHSGFQDQFFTTEKNTLAAKVLPHSQIYFHIFRAQSVLICVYRMIKIDAKIVFARQRDARNGGKKFPEHMESAAPHHKLIYAKMPFSVVLLEFLAKFWRNIVSNVSFLFKNFANILTFCGEINNESSVDTDASERFGKFYSFRNVECRILPVERLVPNNAITM